MDLLMLFLSVGGDMPRFQVQIHEIQINIPVGSAVCSIYSVAAFVHVVTDIVQDRFTAGRYPVGTEPFFIK